VTHTINGTNGNDTISGTSGNDTILAKAGDDVITAGSGNDKVDGGAGNDTIDGGSGNDKIDGGSGNDTITGGSGNDLIDGGSGNDTITGGSGNDLIYGGSGTDTAIFGGNFASYDILDLFGLVVIKGQDGTDVVLDVEYLKFDDGSYNVASNVFTPTPPPALPLVSVVATDGIGTETVDGTDFTFTFSRTGDTSLPLTVSYSIFPAPIDGATPGTDFPAQTGTITFAVGSATAVLSFDALPDALVENTELFSVVVGVGAGYQVDIPNATANASITDGTIYGTPGPDTLVGTNNPDAIVGLDGNDSLDGQAGDDALYGGNGDDGLGGGPGNDYLDGEAGFDRAVYAMGGAPVSIMLAAGTATIGASMDTLRSIELARGTAHDDVFNAVGFGTGSTNASSEGNNFNAFEGLAGNDTVTGNGNTRIEFTNATAGVTVTFATGNSGGATGDASVGTDTFSGTFAVRGSQHNDLIINAGGSNNTFDGQSGFDTVSYASAGAAINVNLQNTAGANVTGGGGNDVLRDNLNAVTIEGIIGTNFNDTFTGNGAANSFDGLAGVDIAVFGATLGASTIIDNGLGGVTVTTGPGGTDTLSNVELLQFTDAYQLTSAGTNADLTNVTMFNPNSIFGTGANETITIGTNQNGRTIDLDGGTDTVLLGLAGIQNYNLGLAGVEFLTGRDDAIENVSVSTTVNGLTADFGVGFDQINLGNGNNTLTAIGIETIVSGSGDDTVTFVVNDANTNQQLFLGTGTNIVNLDGTTTSYIFDAIGGVSQMNGRVGAVDESVEILNGTGGTIFDLGGGNADEVRVNEGLGTNVFTVFNVENVFGALSAHDQIIIGGNGGGTTTVTAGSGSDQVYASGDVDHFRFTSAADSAFDLSEVIPVRDVIFDFDAAEDAFVFDIDGVTDVEWIEVFSGGGNGIVLVDFEGDGAESAGVYTGYEMAIQLQNYSGTLSDSNFLIV
jgi:Ca2+-binding RTX toxin-like protein